MYRKIAILGSGSWATALAKIVMQNQSEINWFIRRLEMIDEFISTGKNPSYLGAAEFDVSRIHFSADINQIVAKSDVLILAIPSPYVKIKKAYNTYPSYQNTLREYFEICMLSIPPRAPFPVSFTCISSNHLISEAFHMYSTNNVLAVYRKKSSSRNPFCINSR